MNTVFGKYVDNGSILTKIDARFKLVAMFVLIFLTFWDFNIWVYFTYFIGIVLITLLGKISLKPIVSFFKGMWIIILIMLIINVLTGDSSLFVSVAGVNLYLDGVIDTVYIVLRLLNLILLSNILTSSTNPSELTYAIEFYLIPLRLANVDVHEIALMMSIAIRFVPTLMEEADKIMKAQTSRGAAFTKGKYSEKIKSIVSLIVPLFVSCFEKSDDLSEAMIVKGYGIGERSIYIREKHQLVDYISICVVVLFIVGIFVANGVL